MSTKNRLTEILSRSKAIMNKTEHEYGSTSNGGEVNSYKEKEIPNLSENYIKNNSKNVTSSVAPKNGRYRNLENSKMPDFIKKAMIENPIDIPDTPFQAFELEDVSDLVNETQKKPKQSISENKNRKTINAKLIRKIVKEEMEEVVRGVIEEYLDKSLVTEDIQIKVGGTTFSGKLRPLPQKRRKKNQL
tara:strand:- start:9743 stop:10309 length:567 start_codon:yes stop_codon:yes gene_type:complete